MAKKIKAGTSGEAAQYMTRGQALKKLQLPLAGFRRLCILKGIYPRDPKKKKKGKDKIYYHTKDVLHIAHEPLLDTFRQIKATDKKVRRALGRKEKQLAKKYARSKPAVRLHHIVRERFPTLSDAVADLDDALSTICIFAMLPADNSRGVNAEYCVKAGQLLDEFLVVASQQRALRRVFASIKGYYFEVQFVGHAITFLMPHQFKQELPEEVDFRVLSTFFELYSTTLHLVVFKLFLLAGLAYPPTATKRESVRRKRRIQKNEEAAVKALAAGRLPRQQEGLHGDGPWGLAGWRYPILQARRIQDAEGRDAEDGPAKKTTGGPSPGESSVKSGGERKGQGSGSEKTGLSNAEEDEPEEGSELADETHSEEPDEETPGGSDSEGEDEESDTEDDGDDPAQAEQSTAAGSGREQKKARKLREAETGGNRAGNEDPVEEDHLGAETASACGVQPHPVQQLFNGCVIFLGREVPLLPFSFMIRSCGGKVGWQGPDSPFSEDHADITHHVVDRPLECLLRVENSQRDYVQPQWVMDSINTGIQLPIHLYAPGKALPPHLSPFVDDRKEGYVPKQREVLDRLVAERKGVAAVGLGSDTARGLDGDDADDSSGDEGAAEKERAFQTEVEREAEANSDSDEGPDSSTDATASNKRSREVIEASTEEQTSMPAAANLNGKARREQEEMDARKSLLRKKHKRLLERIEHGVRRKQQATAKLQAKRNALERQAEMSKGT
ncbi:putative pescadillo family protein [Neospora caninum Liverpool]|uniref:Pescadillo homolog n=1 Tax=Neospora caninum (strain Liverpool) TaxID=572307 RepID=F0VDQ7_NEOCL|nr:putative pescadillo family protein [Neospora caninum Liverpool]CBZ51850.1 putative pescadillo family protein [Neospora caninum Liverpool]CEL65808.1 TPA: pescadillo family protein, putative [Neospora caninum Liverpool]|eukprot:XP_003881883.1 putative pescadillo family protein [Neospora caninum Liverpool]